MNIIEQDVIDLLKNLVAIDSVNPSLSEGACGESKIAQYVYDWAVGEGLTAQIVDDGSGRPNVLVRSRRPEKDSARLLLCGHLDTVGIGAMVDPLLPRVDGDRLYGRGAYDMKAGLAAALVACREVDRLGLPVEVVVASVADEEHASRGIRLLLPDLTADAAIVTEPTEMAIGVAHKGFVWVDIEVAGIAAHGSRPELGVDAIVKTGPILVALEELNQALDKQRHNLLGPGTVHASLITGGKEASTIPERCVLTLERRTLPGETVTDIQSEIEQLLEGCRAADPQLKAAAHTGLHRPPMETAPDDPLVRTLGAAHEQVRGRPAAIGGISFWADSAFIASRGIPTVLFGPGGEGAHADVEWVSLSDTVDCTHMLIIAARSLLRG
ncbi:M20/M25/M40 family metallo-hydrolase [Streptomyces sp. NPDC001750]|uniref:M20/M25/M40 family metallo-hydrolase n=1 Tax=unclassified Streptomyces TaxID=2593676 RepID=UPI0036AAB74A